MTWLIFLVDKNDCDIGKLISLALFIISEDFTLYAFCFKLVLVARRGNIIEENQIFLFFKNNKLKNVLHN